MEFLLWSHDGNEFEKEQKLFFAKIFEMSHSYNIPDIINMCDWIKSKSVSGEPLHIKQFVKMINNSLKKKQ